MIPLGGRGFAQAAGINDHNPLGFKLQYYGIDYKINMTKRRLIIHGIGEKYTFCGREEAAQEFWNGVDK